MSATPRHQLPPTALGSLCHVGGRAVQYLFGRETLGTELSSSFSSPQFLLPPTPSALQATR